MSSAISFSDLKDFLIKEDLMIVSKKQFKDVLIEVNVKSKVDKRVLWIGRTEAIAKYGVTRFWLKNAEKDAFSVLKFKKGSGKTSATKYNEQSIIDELQRQI